ncbi:MAG: D-alanyl-D-alanine carboxypeptidase/D-alanyl-D-alanine-endopeptidase [Deltaproteobacteria bacterium]|nr:D-alanyl-D-alanine carboxypeptidase/D-alanyl-D-alanine-endopeptidase [Deltaproteobacteria bacterium]
MRYKYLILLAFVVCSQAWAAPADFAAKIKKIASAPNQAIAVSIVDLANGQELAGLNANATLKPASVMKVLTSAAALEELGVEYRFSTELFYDRRSGGQIETLYIRGGADPSLTLESLWLVVRKLRKLGVTQINRVVLDDSRFMTQRTRVGQRAYETGSSALALSFNSIAFDVCPGAVGNAALVSVDPWEASVQLRGSIKTVAGRGGQFSIDEVQSPSGGLTYSIGGTFGAGRSCETFYRSVDEPLVYFGSVFRGFCADLGIKVLSAPVSGSTPEGAKFLARHQSKALSLVLEDMNHFSTNFIAEQVLYALGQGSDGSFDRQRGLERIRKYLIESGVPKEDFTLFDGSGLSHDNRLTAAAITKVLRRAVLNNHSGVEFEKSLSVGGENGTLKDRNFGDGVVLRGKTGTLDGVSTLAGVVETRSGRKVAFAILQNGKLGKDAAAAIEEKIVTELYHSL